MVTALPRMTLARPKLTIKPRDQLHTFRRFKMAADESVLLTLSLLIVRNLTLSYLASMSWLNWLRAYSSDLMTATQQVQHAQDGLLTCELTSGPAYCQRIMALRSAFVNLVRVQQGLSTASRPAAPFACPEISAAEVNGTMSLQMDCDCLYVISRVQSVIDVDLLDWSDSHLTLHVRYSVLCLQNHCMLTKVHFFSPGRLGAAVCSRSPARCAYSSRTFQLDKLTV